jgi:hypothetical protein
MEPTEPVAPPPPRRSWKKPALFIAALLAAYFITAYVVVPLAWEGYAWRHPSFDDDPRITETGDKHPGDPLNVALVGTEAQLKAIMQAANWHQAAALGLESDLKIAADTVISRPDDEAPVSNLFLYGRKEDLAYEQQVGDNPRHRHHVRFWKSPDPAPDGRPTWMGSASYDERVGLSRTTGQITHHIAPDVDVERDHLFQTLEATHDLAEQYVEQGFHKILAGKNGGGDPWHTDGDLWVGLIKDESQTAPVGQ